MGVGGVQEGEMHLYVCVYLIFLERPQRVSARGFYLSVKHRRVVRILTDEDECQDGLEGEQGA